MRGREERRGKDIRSLVLNSTIVPIYTFSCSNLEFCSCVGSVWECGKKDGEVSDDTQSTGVCGPYLQYS